MIYARLTFLASFFLGLIQEFRGVVGLTGSMDLESDMTKLPARTVEILASCHALVFVDNKLVCYWLTSVYKCVLLRTLLLLFRIE